MIVFFLDTNLFIQCLDLKQINWNEILDCDEILLLVTQAVNKEINNHKNDGNSRRAKRARKAYSLFKELLKCYPQSILLTKNNPPVRIEFLPKIKITTDFPTLLDITQTDDRIIAEAIEYKKNNPNDDIFLLTNDTSMMFTAKSCNLEYKEIPENWFLKPENDSNQKRIIALEKQNKDLLNKLPQIKILAKDKFNNSVQNICINVLKFKNFKESDIDIFLNSVKCKFPMTLDFSEQKSTNQKIPFKIKNLNNMSKVSGIKYEYIPPSDVEILNYREERYFDWIEKVERYFRSVPKYLEENTRFYELDFILTNEGNIFAENVIVDIELLGNLKFNIPPIEGFKYTLTNMINLPPPPTPPKGKWVEKKSNSLPNNMIDIMFKKHDLLASFKTDPIVLSNPNLLPFNNEYKRDRHDFYWKPQKPETQSSKWTFECEQFRHKVEEENFNLTIILPQDEDIEKGAIKFRVTAKNLPEPHEIIIPLVINYNEKDAVSITKDLINKLEYKD